MLGVQPNTGLELRTLTSRPELISSWMLNQLSDPGAPLARDFLNEMGSLCLTALAYLWFPWKSLNLLPWGLQDYPFVDKEESSEAVPAKPNPCVYSFLPVGLDGGLVLPGRDCSATVNPWLQEQLPCIPVGIDVMYEQSLNAAILLKNHLVDFIIVCHLGALLIRVQQVLLTRRIGNKGMLRACSYNSHTDWNQKVLHNKYHLIWWLCVYVHKVTGRQVKNVPLLIVCNYL